MKELGAYLRQARIDNGVSLDEAADDNNLSAAELENIERGNIRAFKDVYKLKGYIKSYAKYLGLDYEKVVDEFNDFLFEHTSKISLDDIKKARSQFEEEEKKIKSPYTKEYKEKKDYRPILYVFLFVVLVAVVVYFIFVLLTTKSKHKEILMSKEVEHEFTYKVNCF